jgi:prepilin-type N-terminal cleavage/methylation domain-containing protein
MSRRSRRYTQGTTLVELMIVVVILGILAALAGVGYKRYVARSRLSEAHGMLAELAAKEQLYFMEFGAYVPARADTSTNPLVQPSVDESAAAFIPTDPTAADFESARTAHPIGTMQNAWARLGLKPQWPALYCSYLVNAGGANQALPAGIGSQLWAAAPPVPWFYAVAACNLDTSDGTTAPTGLPTNANATFLVLTHDSPAIRVLNDGH